MRPLALLALLLAAAPAAAQEGARLAFALGLGVESRPAYFGAAEQEIGPDLSFSLGAARLGPLRFGDFEGRAESGWGFRGSFRWIPGRSAGDHPELAGLPDVDAALELGGGVDYAAPWWEAFAVARYGVLGHGALVAEAGMDLIARPTDRLTLRAGPRLLWGSDGFAEAYFGVEEPAGAFPAFAARGGLLSSGAVLAAEYRLGGAWSLAAQARYDRLQADAAASPVTAKDDQWSASLGVVRRFDIRF